MKLPLPNRPNILHNITAPSYSTFASQRKYTKDKDGKTKYLSYDRSASILSGKLTVESKCHIQLNSSLIGPTVTVGGSLQVAQWCFVTR